MSTLIEPASSTVSDVIDPAHSTFPVEALPGPIRSFVEEGAKSLPVPPELLAIPALVAAGTAIGNARHIRIKADWTESPSLYAAVVSNPGSMKSPALNLATQPLKDLQSAGSRTWTSDVTVESLVRLLAKTQRGLLLSRDELSAWVKSMNQYRGGKGADKEFYLSVWGGQDYTYDRASDGGTNIALHRPFLSVVGNIPPEVLPSLDISGGEADGFLPRILYSWPEPIPVRYTDTEISPETLQSYTTLIQTLYGLPYELNEGPTYLGFTDQAQQEFIAWHDLHLEEGEEGAFSPFLKGVYAKLKGYCAHVALIHTLCRDSQTTVVDEKSLYAAIDLVEYFKFQAKKVDQMFDHQTDGPVERCKGGIRRQLLKCRFLKKRDLQRYLRKAWRVPEILKQALEEMSKAEIVIENGVVRWNR